MPIYAYRCSACGLAKDVLQKVSDAVLSICPACRAAAFQKQLSAPSFQLKGTGWYATDFKNSGKPPAAPERADKTDGDATGASKDDKAAPAAAPPAADAPSAAPASPAPASPAPASSTSKKS